MEVTVRSRTLAAWAVSHKLHSHSKHTDSGTQTQQNTDVFMSLNTLCASSRYLHYQCAIHPKPSTEHSITDKLWPSEFVHSIYE